MTAILAQPRLKVFDIPHKGLRNALSQFTLLAGQTDYRDAFEVERLHRLGQDVFTMLTVHAGDENHYTLAELEKRSPGAARHNLDEHEIIEQNQARLEHWLDDLLARVKAGEDVTPEGEPFFRALGHFHSEYLKHMLEEEEETQAQVWAHFTDADLLDIRKKIIVNMAPEVVLLWVKYSAPAQTHADRTKWMRGMKAGAPAAFFDRVMQVLAGVLTPVQMEMLRFELG